jgi:hypothetical protein
MYKGHIKFPALPFRAGRARRELIVHASDVVVGQWTSGDVAALSCCADDTPGKRVRDGTLGCSTISLPTGDEAEQTVRRHPRLAGSLRLRAYLAMSRLRPRSITMQGSSRPTLTMSRYASMPARERPSGTSERHFVSLAHRPGVDQQSGRRIVGQAWKRSLNCKNAKCPRQCPRQDSNLRHRLLQR